VAAVLNFPDNGTGAIQDIVFLILMASVNASMLLYLCFKKAALNILQDVHWS